MKALLTKFEAYLLTERRVSPHTYDAYCTDLKQLALYLDQQQIVDERLSLEHIKNFLKMLKDKHLSARSMARKISSLKTFFNWAHETNGTDNLAADLSFPKIERRLPSYLTEQEVEELLSCAQEDTSAIGMRNSVMLYLLYVSGMRISELTELKISSLHEDTGFISVQGKGGKGRMIPIPVNVITLVREYLNTVHKNFVAQKGETEYMFPTSYSKTIKPISRQAFWTILKGLCKKTSIQRSISPHQLRHSLATHLLKKGANLRSLQMLLGHENLATVQIYTHLETDHLRDEYDKKHPRS